MFNNLIGFIGRNVHLVPDIFFGFLAVISIFSLLSVPLAFFVAKDSKGAKRYSQLSFGLSVMLLSPAILYYELTVKLGHGRWICAFGCMFFMFLLSKFVSRFLLSEEST